MRHKAPVFVAVALTYAFQLTVFGPVKWQLAYSYHHWLGDPRLSMPSLTANWALPVLGPGGLEGSPTALYYAFWALVLLPPAVLAWRTWTDASESATLQRFVYWGSSYALVVGLAYMLVLFGLWLPSSAA